MILYTVTCIATAGSNDANKNRFLISPFPGNLNLFSTYASCVPTTTDIASTHTITITELINARPMFAVLNAVIKLSKLRKLFGSVITLVESYSSFVLKAVITHDTRGITAHNEKNISEPYSTIRHIICPAV